MTDTIYVGMEDLIAIRDFLEVDRREETFALGLEVNDYGTTKFLTPLQIKVDMNGLTILSGKDEKVKNLPFKNVYTSMMDSSIVLEVEDEYSKILEFRFTEYNRFIL